MTDRVIQTAIATAKKYGKVIVADVQKDMDRYKGITAMTPNQPDTEKYVGFFIQDEETLKKAGEKLIEKELENVTNEKVRSLTREHLKDIAEGKRDFRF